jgi:signal transduction histidine kinase
MIFTRRQGIRRRLAMLYVSIFGVLLGVFCALLFQYFQRIQKEAFDTILYNYAVDFATNLEMDFVGRLFVVDTHLPESGKFFPFHLGASFFEIRDINGKVLMHSKSLKDRRLPLSPSLLEQVKREKAAIQTIKASSLGLRSSTPDLRLLTYFANRADWREPLILQLAVPMDLPNQERREMLLFFMICIPLFLVIAWVAGMWMSRHALKPVHDMTLKAAGITGVENLKERIPVPQTADEISELAQTFNSLLDRLDKAFTSQDRFISNASHQLKTPLTILKNELHLLRRAQAAGADLGTGLDSAAQEIQRLILLVQDLLLLARLEAGKDTITFSKVRLDEVMMQVVARLERLSKEKEVRIRSQVTAYEPGHELETEVQGDEELIDSMLENFVENAIKYAPSGSDVEVTLKILPKGADISVRDYGPGIPESTRQKMFERFSRGKPSSEIPGSGLGLSIAAEIARIHSVQLNLTAPPSGSGTLVTLSFPRV